MNNKKMVKMFFSCLLSLALILSNAVVMAEGTAPFSGSGTEADPYLINTATDLETLSTLSNTASNSLFLQYNDKHYRLTADIDMTGKVFDGLSCTVQGTPHNGGAGLNGTSGEAYFTGTFDGYGHVIKNLTIDSEGIGRYRGFISYASGATVKNLGLENATIRGKDAGGFIGWDKGGNSTIENCYIKNSTFGNGSQRTDKANAGALIARAGENEAKATVINNCYAVGNQQEGTINYFSHMVNGVDGTGYIKFTNCYTDGSAPTQGSVGQVEGSGNTHRNATSSAPTVATMGAGFTADTDNKNNGMPRLTWEFNPFPVFKGSGTEEDPYLINNATELEILSRLSNTATNGLFLQYNDKHYKLTADIDMAGKVFDGLSCTVQGTPHNGGYGLNGANGEAYFTGTFDGYGHVIKNLTIDSEGIGRYRGFISYASGATIKNLGIENATIRGKDAGGFIGWDRGGNSTIENCYIKNSTFGNGSERTDKANAGALIARAGENEAKATVINNCYAVGNQAESNVGYFSHMVNGVDGAGYIKFTNCYTDGSAPTQGSVGQVEGSGNTHRNATTSAPTVATMGAGFTADTDNKNNGMPRLLWELGLEPETPPEVLEYEFSGSGTEEDPYLINTAEDLEALSTLSNTATNSVFLQYNDKHYKLTADIDMTGKVFDGLSCTVQGTPHNKGAGLNDANGEAYFTGTFDGDGHIIKNLTIDSEGIGRYRGFISYASGATVKNLGIENATIRGKDAGGFIGWDKGGNSTIENCYIKNSTFGNGSERTDKANAGALIARAGENEAKATVINNCYAVGNQQEGTINYFSHMVNGVDGAGYIKFTNCYTDGSAPTQGAVTQVEGSGNTHRNATTSAPTAATLGAGFSVDAIGVNNGLPILKWQIGTLFSTNVGDGSEKNPYEIATADDLVLLNKLSNTATSSSYWSDKHYILVNDIDMTGKRFDGLFCAVQGVPDFNNGYTVTVSSFAGVFDGNGHVISNLNIDAGDLTRSRGFISYASEATIKNLGIEDSTIRGAGVGAIIGNDNGGYSTIENCYARNITLSYNLGYDPKTEGGLVGVANSTIIADSYSVQINGATAGIAASGAADIVNCYTNHAALHSNESDAFIENSYKSATGATVNATVMGKAFKDDISSENNGLPLLVWEAQEVPFSQGLGTGTENDPFIIATADDLALLNELSNTQATSALWSTKCFKLVNDIDMTGKRFDGLFCEVQGVPDFNNGYTVTVSSFKGVFDGNGHTVSGLSIDSKKLTRNRGFISYAQGATIKNLGVSNSTILGSTPGGILGRDNGGTVIENCFVKNVTFGNGSECTGTVYPGGIIAILSKVEAAPTVIKNCYTLNLTGADSGLIVARTTEDKYAQVLNCYTDAPYNVTGSIIGTMSNSYRNAGTLTKAHLLGDAFSDNDTINGGLPVLNWEIGDPILSIELDTEKQKANIWCSFSPSEVPAIMVVSGYNLNNAMTGSYMMPITVNEGNNEFSYNLGDALYTKVGAYIWNNFSDLKKYCQTR